MMVPVQKLARRMLRGPVEELRDYRLGELRRDVVAGLSVAVIAVPQSLAYALIAGVPPEYGLYTLIVQSAIGCLFSSQPMLSSGPINTQSLLVAAVATRVLDDPGFAQIGIDPGVLYLQLVIGLTLLKGAMQIALAAGGLGNLVRYVSASVILGFTAGAGVLIAAGQLGAFLGIDVPQDPQRWPGLAGTWQGLAPHLSEVRPASIAMGAFCLAIVVGGRAVSRLFPGPLVAVVAAAVVVATLGLDADDLPLVAALPSSLPSFAVPEFRIEWIEPLLGGAFALSVLGLMEAWSIAKTIAARTGEAPSATQELLSQGITSFVSSFFGAIPGSSSFSRSTLNFHAGAATRYAGIWNSLFAAAMLLALGPQAALIPRASLAAVLFVIAYDLVDWRGVARMLRTSRSDASVCLATLAATLLIPLSYAVFVGVLLNIALYLRRASRLHLAEMISHPDDPEGGRFLERPLLEESGQNPVVFIQLQGDLFFGQADELAERLAQLQAGNARVVVIRLKRTLSIDSTVLGVFERFARAMAERGGHVILCGVLPQVTRALRGYGIVQAIGEDCFFEATPGVFASAHRALDRARELCGQELDPARVAESLDPDEGA